MALFKVRRTIKPGVIPAGLTYGEMAVNLTDRKLYVGGTANNSIEILGGGGGSAESTWTSAEPTTATDIAGIPQGTTIDVGSTAIEILEQILYPYQSVAFTGITTGLASSYELGQTGGNGAATVSWTRSGPTGNWLANSAYISYSGLASGIALTAGSPTANSASVTYPPFRATTLGSNSVTISLTGAQEEGSNPSISATRSWWSRLYWGKSTDASLTDPSSLSLGSTSLITNKSTSSQTTTLTASAGSGYFYVFIHDDYDISKMTLAGFDVSLATTTTASVMNSYGFSTTYKIYRSTNQLNGDLSVIVTYSY
jgi:hypothetical protein